MLDEANTNFVNGVVTVIRWGFYFIIAILAIGAVGSLLSWLWKIIRPVTDKGELEKARRRMRDLGY